MTLMSIIYAHINKSGGAERLALSCNLNDDSGVTGRESAAGRRHDDTEVRGRINELAREVHKFFDYQGV